MRIAEINAYGFDIKSLNFILSYFSNCKQKIKISSRFSDFLNIIFGVSQGSIIESILFIIDVCDFFMKHDIMEFANYVGNTTPYTYGQSFKEMVKQLEVDMSKIYDLFHHNGLKVNPGKFHCLLNPFVGRPINIIRSTTKANKKRCYYE